ncbi:MAG: hypothetical protein LBM25_06015 [Bacteroidales bacterium]|jgi:hypothetical protein|nr:hypothetical protein [Bacteroidales bacterium]
MTPKYFFIIILLFFATSCSKNYKEGVYLDENGYYVFLIDNKFYTFLKWDEYKLFLSRYSDDSVFSDFGHFYLKQNLDINNFKYDTIDVANSAISHYLGFIYNLRIVNRKWMISIIPQIGYNPLKGTYVFDINKSEDRLFKSALNNLQSNAKQHYYPYRGDTSWMEKYGPASAIYLGIKNNEINTEYFGTTMTDINGQQSIFNMIDQLTMAIMNHYILPDINKYKINDSINLWNIRQQFNSYVERDCCTGEILINPDVDFPPEPDTED